jgi:hypothetical protein
VVKLVQLEHTSCDALALLRRTGCDELGTAAVLRRACSLALNRSERTRGPEGTHVSLGG